MLQTTLSGDVPSSLRRQGIIDLQNVILRLRLIYRLSDKIYYSAVVLLGSPMADRMIYNLGLICLGHVYFTTGFICLGTLLFYVRQRASLYEGGVKKIKLSGLFMVPLLLVQQ